MSRRGISPTASPALWPRAELWRAPSGIRAGPSPRGGLAPLVLSLLLAFAGCARLPSVPAPADLPPRFSIPGEVPRSERWWRDLGDPALSAVIEQALAENLTLRGAWDRLVQARAVAERAGAPLWPQLGSSLSRTQGFERTGTPEPTSRERLDLRYEVDLWGRLAANRRAAALDRQVAREDLDATALALAAEVAATWLSRVEQRGQLDLIDRQIESIAQILDLVTLRFRSGQVGAADVLRQRQLLEQVRGERIQIEEREALLSHQLAVLLARAPGADGLDVPARLPDPTPLPVTGLPSDLLRRRPDVRRAHARVLAADQRLAAARADLYPSVVLSADLLLPSAKHASPSEQWTAALVGDLVGPLFDGGQREAEVARTRAVVSERLHEYGAVVLDALREVEDALVEQRQQRELIASLEQQRVLAEQTLARVRDRYTKGATPYLDVLNALQTQQRLEREHLRARAELLGLRIALHRALAGGFELSEPALADWPERSP